MNIEGKIIVITGASSGIGRATALRLVEAGAKVVLGARREEPLADLAAEISAAGHEAVFRPTDVRRRADVQALADLALERFGRLDVWVSNAGIGPISKFDALRVDDWDAMIDINIKGVLYGIAAALPIFRRQGAGHFVHVVSTAGLQLVPTMGVYAGTKNAVRTITEVLRQEAGPDLRVTEISPGMTSTNFGDSITEEAVREGIERRLGDIGMSPDAIARGIAFAIGQPADVDVGSIVIRPTAQG